LPGKYFTFQTVEDGFESYPASTCPGLTRLLKERHRIKTITEDEEGPIPDLRETLPGQAARIAGTYR